MLSLNIYYGLNIKHQTHKYHIITRNDSSQNPAKLETFLHCEVLFLVDKKLK